MRILFDGYEAYKAAQVEKNARKFKTVWAKKGEMRAVADIVLENAKPAFGICHGVRNGWEVRELRKLLSCPVIGTDIAQTASAVEHCISHDFHEPRAEWLGSAGFVYSNSLDHAYDPARALRTWVGQLRPGGVLIVGWFEKSGIDMADCFSASRDEIDDMLANCGDGTARRTSVSRDRYMLHWTRRRQND